jgi:protein O-GlcNAc transferase
MKEPFHSEEQASSMAGAFQAHLSLGDTFVEKARLSEAETCYRLAIALQPDSSVAQASLGKLLRKRGMLREAEVYYRRAIALQPHFAVYYYYLGNLFYDDRPVEAEACYRRAIELQPDFALAYSNLGSLLSKQNRVAEEETCFRTAVVYSPELAEAHNNLGKTLRKQGKLAESEACHRRAIELKSDLAEIHYNLGEVLVERGRSDEAEPCFLRAIELKAGLAEAHSRLAQVLARRGAVTEAEACYRRAIQHKPHFAAALYGLANLLYAEGRILEAATCYEKVIELSPNSAFSYSNLGNILSSQGHVSEEELCYRRAIELRPNFAAAHSNLGNTLKGQGKHIEARACYERAIEINPNFAEAHCNLGTLLQEQGQLADAEACYRRSLAIMPGFAIAHSNLLFCLLHSPVSKPHDIFLEHRQFAERFEKPLRHGWVKHANSRDPGRALKIGFVSGDLRSHPIAFLTEPILAHLARTPDLSLYAYANHANDDPVTDSIRTHFQHWNRITHLSDTAVAEKIRSDRIDILIDLSGHTANNRLLTFARKPAPVQGSWVGYLGTTGLSGMDYYLADRFMLPITPFQAQFTEKIVHLPAAASYRPRQDAPAVNHLPALQHGYLSFGSFNRVSKLNPGVIKLWSELLRASPSARMVVGNLGTSCAADRVVHWFLREGISRDRLRVHLKCDPAAYLGLYHEVDICLDTFPFTGFTTTLDAMWMGVPTLTLAGGTPPSLQSASMLCHVGLEEFIARDASDFVARGVRLVTSAEALSQLRLGFRERFQKSILGQPQVIASGLRNALRTMWVHWCEGSSSGSI